MSKEYSTQKLAAEAMDALRMLPQDSKLIFKQLIERGWINARGEVTRLLGGDAEPEPYANNYGPQEAQDNHATDQSK